MHPIEYIAPTFLDEAVELFRKHGSAARALAGGTDLIAQMRTGRRRDPVVIDVKKIPELTSIHWAPTKGLTLGAAAPCYRIYQDSEVRACYPGRRFLL